MSEKINIEIEITFDEWREAGKSFSLLASDATSPQSAVCVFSDGQVRRWLMGYGHNCVLTKTESDVRVYTFLLSRDAFIAGLDIAELEGSCTVQLRNDDVVNLVGRSRSFQFVGDHSDYPIHHFQSTPDDDDCTFTINCGDLHAAVKAGAPLHLRQAGEETRIELFATDDSLEVTSFESLGGILSGSIPISNVEGLTQVIAVVDPFAMMRVLEVFSFGDDIRVSIRIDTSDPVLISHDDRSASIQTFRPPEHEAIEHAKEIVKSVCGALALYPDQDRDFHLVRHKYEVFGRFEIERRQPIFQVFAVLLNGVESSPELLHEINELNTNIKFGRVFWVENQVLVEADLVAKTLDVPELRRALDRIMNTAEEIAPMLAAVFGGSVWPNPVEVRWSYYRNTVVSANVTPTSTVALNGPNAVDEWPFEGNVYVITGWNPQGVERDGDYVNSQIAADVLQRGGSFVRGAGSSVDGDHSEPSLVIWGIERQEALTIGSNANQDAIFEVTSESISILSCDNGYSETAPRKYELTY